MEEYDRRTALYQKGQLKELPKEPVQDYSTLISRFKPIAKNYRYGKGADAILYITAFALYEHGKRDEAAKIFEEMLKTYPYSDYFLEVSFRLGEFYFETGQMGEALEAYKKRLTFATPCFTKRPCIKSAGYITRLMTLKNRPSLLCLFLILNGARMASRMGLPRRR